MHYQSFTLAAVEILNGRRVSGQESSSHRDGSRSGDQAADFHYKFAQAEIGFDTGGPRRENAKKLEELTLRKDGRRGKINPTE
jgi:hypothetical protein